MNQFELENIEIATKGISDQNSNIPFLRNEFSRISEDVFTMTLFTKISHIFDQTNSIPTAWGLISMSTEKQEYFSPNFIIF